MAGGAEWRPAIEAARAEAQRLRLENWRLAGELRRELSQEACAGQLHRQRVAAAAVAAQQPQQEADASAGAPSMAAAPPSQALGAADADVEASQQALAEAEGRNRKLREEVNYLKSALRERSDLKALEREVVRMRELLAQPEEAWHTGGLLLSDEQGEELQEEGGEDAPGVLLAEVSFEMLATIGEAELAEEKKALQREVRRLQAELRSPSQQRRPPVPAAAAKAPSAADVPALRERRRMQQLDAIAQRLHEEFQRRSAAKAAAGLPTGVPPAAALAPAMEAPLDLRGQFLDEKIKALSHRFLLIRDLC